MLSCEGHGVREPRNDVDAVIAEYLKAIDRGEQPSPEKIVAEHPGIADELAAFFVNSDDFDRVTMPLRTVATRPPQDVADLLDTEQRFFGDYELLDEIARGGMGVVYKARQVNLNRIVAVKMILAGRFASPEDVQRFRAEAEAAANLEHPGIVPIHEVGVHDGQHYFSMAYVDGPSLAKQLCEGSMPFRQAATLMKEVCDAVQYAHEHGVLHRDLKPANILLAAADSGPLKGPNRANGIESQNNVTSSGLQPKITDFGLAKRLNSDSYLTRTGQVIGTPCYMSPEQAAGATDIGPASDVYSLGAILYQLLTNKPPFHSESPLDTLSHLVDSEPVAPRLLDRNVPPELNAVCLKCLEKEPHRRYSSSRELSDELQRYLNGDPVHAASANVLDRLRRAVRLSRHEEHFRGWGLGLILFGLVILFSHAAIFIAERNMSHPWASYLLPRGVMFAALLITLWRSRSHSLLPTNSPERLVWVVWIGYLMALGAINVSRYVFGHDHQEVYASSAALAGLGFLVMGSHVWGGSYVIGSVFIVAAPLLAIFQEAASLILGTLWAGGLVSFGLHYWFKRSH